MVEPDPSLVQDDGCAVGFGFLIYGGAYRRYWDGKASLRRHAETTILSPGHVLLREAEELLRTEFHQEALCASILRAVADGEERPSDIARAVGRRSADEIFDHIRRLQELRFLRREVPVTELERTRTQRVLYRLADPYLRFWFRFVSTYQSFLQLGKGEELWVREIAPDLDEFVARSTWEEVCIQHLWRRLRHDSIDAKFNQLGRWWDGKEEIDLVGLWRGKATLVGECKWSSTPIGMDVLSDLQTKTTKLPLRSEPLWVLASLSGFEPEVEKVAAQGRVLLVTPKDMFD